MEFYKELIRAFMGVDNNLYYEWNDDQAKFLFNALVENIKEFAQLFDYYHAIMIKDRDGEDIYVLDNYEIYLCDTDAIEEMVDGSCNFEGACTFKSGEDMRFIIQTRNFRIYDAMAVNMETNREVPLVDKGKIVNGLVRVTSKVGPQSYGNSYRYIHGERIE